MRVKWASLRRTGASTASSQGPGPPTSAIVSMSWGGRLERRRSAAGAPSQSPAPPTPFTASDRALMKSRSAAVVLGRRAPAKSEEAQAPAATAGPDGPASSRGRAGKAASPFGGGGGGVPQKGDARVLLNDEKRRVDSSVGSVQL